MYLNKDRWVGVAVFLTVWGLALISCCSNTLPFRGDAYAIWETSKVFFDSSRPPPIFIEYRGPFVFFFYHGIYRVSQLIKVDDVIFFRAYSSLLFSALTILLVPYVFSRFLDRKISIPQKLFFSAVVFYFFNGYFLYPQVDFLAFFLLICSIAMLQTCDTNPRHLWLASGGAGVLLAFAIMTRFNYILATPFLVAYISVNWLKGNGWLAKVVLVSCFVLPLLVLVGANATRSDNGRVLSRQLVGGLQFQKVEWNTGDTTLPSAVFVKDEHGTALIKTLEGPPFQLTQISFTDYLGLFSKHPLDFAAIWMQHLFCGLDIWYDAPYVYDIRSSRVTRSLLNYTLFFLGLIAFQDYLLAWSGKKWRRLLLMLAVTIPALSAVPFVIEVRFFIPVIIVIYAMAIFSIKEAVQMVRENYLTQHLVIFISLCALLSLRVMNSIENFVTL